MVRLRDKMCRIKDGPLSKQGNHIEQWPPHFKIHRIHGLWLPFAIFQLLVPVVLSRSLVLVPVILSLLASLLLFPYLGGRSRVCTPHGCGRVVMMGFRMILKYSSWGTLDYSGTTECHNEVMSTQAEITWPMFIL